MPLRGFARFAIIDADGAKRRHTDTGDRQHYLQKKERTRRAHL